MFINHQLQCPMEASIAVAIGKQKLGSQLND